MRAATRRRRFELSMQAFVCHCWLLSEGMVYGLRREIMLEYAKLAGWRSGAGVDGLQGSCRTAVFGELDWSPGVHEQCVGRIHRDGQPEPCVAYFLCADDGADPIMVDVLGIKREQIEGVRNPNRALAERVETGENNIRRLAREFLIKRGVKVDEEKAALSISKEAV